MSNILPHCQKKPPRFFPEVVDNLQEEEVRILVLAILQVGKC